LNNRIHEPVHDHAVAVTGIGMICPLGITTPECWENMLQSKSGIRRITKFDPSECLTQIGGQLPERYFELEKERISKRLFKQTIQVTRIIRLCSHEAVEDSRLELEKLDPYRCGVIIGTSGSSVRSPHDLGGPDVERFKIIREMVNGPPAWISLDYGFKGPTYTISAACSSGSYAISRAYDLIRWGVVDIAIAGGVDCLLTENNIRRGNFLKILSEDKGEPEKVMRPFDKMRSGFVLSDGGCAVVLESYEHAIKRNARVYAWIAGYGSSSESYSLYSPAPYGEGMARSMEIALINANIPKEKIGYVNANGTSTIVNDFCETMALKKVFGEHAYRLFVSSQKSMLGHTMGGSSAIEFAVTALVLNSGKIPPTVNYEFPDPACGLNYVPNSMITVNHMGVAITNSFGIGGHNCVIVLKKSL
jgi:3-oxoacyl-[acyl-carrier-protein] synthase II